MGAPSRHTTMKPLGQSTFWARDYFDAVGSRRSYRLRCKRCGQEVKPNALGASSHIAKHVLDTIGRGGAL